MNFLDLSTVTFSLAQCRTTRTTTDDDRLCKTKKKKKLNKINKPEATHSSRAAVSLAEASLKTAFGCLNKNIILAFCKLKLLSSFFYYIQ